MRMVQQVRLPVALALRCCLVQQHTDKMQRGRNHRPAAHWRPGIDTRT